MVLFFALLVGIPMWLVLRRPDTGPQSAQASALAYLSTQQYDDPSYLAAA